MTVAILLALVTAGVLFAEPCAHSAMELRKTADQLVGAGRFEDAEQQIRKCLADWSNAGPVVEEADKVGASAYLGLVLSLVGRYDEAEVILKDAYSRAQKFDSHAVAVSAAYLGALYRYKGDYHRALPLIRVSIQRFADARGPRDANVAMTLVELGAVHANEAKFTLAEGAFRQACEIMRERDMQVELRSCHTYLASVQIDQGRYAEAEALLLRVVNDKRDPTAIGDATYSLGLYNLARLYRLSGKREKAEAFYTQAIQAYETGLVQPFPRLEEVVIEYAAYLKKTRSPEAPVWSARAQRYLNAMRQRR